MKTGIFYGSTTGKTAEVAKYIAKELNVASEDIHDVSKTSPSKVGDYDFLIFGSPTYGSGELQEDWYDFLDGVSVLDLNGKRVAIFGLGDETMSDTFCGAVGAIYKKVKETGAEIVGRYNTFPYRFEVSEAVPVKGGEAVGLLIDEINHPEATEGRIKEWVKTLN